jgi:hypothetical protein
VPEQELAALFVDDLPVRQGSAAVPVAHCRLMPLHCCALYCQVVQHVLAVPPQELRLLQNGQPARHSTQNPLRIPRKSESDLPNWQ